MQLLYSACSGGRDAVQGSVDPSVRGGGQGYVSDLPQSSVTGRNVDLKSKSKCHSCWLVDNLTVCVMMCC